MAVYRRNGSWFIGYPIGNGKYRREKIGANHALAKEVLAKRLAEVAEGRFFPGRAANAKKFGEFAKRFWDLHARHLRGRSWRLMHRDAEKRFGKMSMGRVGAADIQKYYNEIASRASNATANRHLSLLRLMFNKARAWGDFHGDNPCAAVRKQRENPHRLRYLSTDEIERLLAAAHPRLCPILVCALMTGMRRGEILGLDWENVSLEHDTLYLLQCKSGKPREVPVASKLREMLLRMGPKPKGPVFELAVIMIRRYFERALAAADIHGFRFHDLRHTFASHFIMRTNDLPALQRILGHSTPAMTLRYAHLSKGHLASEMAAFESAMPVAPRALPVCANTAAQSLDSPQRPVPEETGK
jgi:integrase